MRAHTLLIAAAAVAGMGGRAVAGNFVEVAAGVMMPVADDDWTNEIESGPKLAARVGGTGQENVGGLFSIDWSPLSTDDSRFGNAVDISAYRVRIQLNVFADRKLAPKIFGSVRVGGGIDITHVNIDTNLGPFSTHVDDTDSGIAFEAAGGLWFSLGSVQVGGELALPLAFHSDGPEDDYDGADYTSFDVDILFGVRLMQH